MAELQFLLIPILLLNGVCKAITIKTILMHPFTCSDVPVKACNSYLYRVSGDLKPGDVASLYSANASLIKPIMQQGNKQDYLVSVPCACNDADGTIAYFHGSEYTVRSGDTVDNITADVYGGQAWNVSGGEENIYPGQVIPIHLVCGCLGGDHEPGLVVVTYTVQQYDTLSAIADLLSSDVAGIERLNGWLAGNSGYIDIGWVLFVPMGEKVAPHKAKKNITAIIVGVTMSIAFLVVGVFFWIFHRRRNIGALQLNVEAPAKTMSKSRSAKNIASLENHYLQRETNEEVQPFESERPVTFSLEEVEGATANFDETRKIGEGGYGSVYYGMLGKQEVAIKKMKSNKSKEFFAELKVLCKVHHINVVELIGYATGEGHLYLVYEYVQNGSLNEHLHDPLLKGHQPLTWNARAKIALDAARGIEYIHDHTKARYVHRDIKTSNILLDDGLRAKVADFGLAKLVERTDEEDCIATRLVGTPGYLPPECVRELQMTTKTDVFGFGVVLAELITGCRALIRDNREPNRMKSLVSIIGGVFQEEDPENALEAIVDGNLRGSYPTEEVYKMAEISMWCLSEEAVNRPEMGEIVVTLSQILMASIEWEASLGGDSEVFSGIFNGR